MLEIIEKNYITITYNKKWLLGPDDVTSHHKVPFLMM